MSNALELPSILDLVAAPGLLEAFTSRRGNALAVDAGGVQRLGAQCLQVLLAARAAWAADGMELLVENLSGEFSAALELMGATQGDLTHDAQQDGPIHDNKELAA
jgi:chemotaxis protein CheX